MKGERETKEKRKKSRVKEDTKVEIVQVGMLTGSYKAYMLESRKGFII